MEEKELVKLLAGGFLLKKTDERLDKIEKQISLMNREIKSLLKEAKDNKIESIIKQLRRLSNTIDSTGDNMKPSKINDLLHGVENGIMEKLESIEELLYKQAEKVKEVKK